MPSDITSFFDLLQNTINEVIDTHNKVIETNDEVITFSLAQNDQLTISLLNIELLKALDKLKKKYTSLKNIHLNHLCNHIEALISDFFRSQKVGIYFKEGDYYYYWYYLMGMGIKFVKLPLEKADKSFMDNFTASQKTLQQYSSRLGVYPKTREKRIETISGQLVLTPHTYIPTPQAVFEKAYNFLPVETASAEESRFMVTMRKKPLFLDFGIGTGDFWEYAETRINSITRLPIRVIGFDSSPEMVVTAKKRLYETVSQSEVYEADITDKDYGIDTYSMFCLTFHTDACGLPIDISKCGVLLIDALNDADTIKNFLDWLYPALLPPGFKMFISVVMENDKLSREKQQKINAIKAALEDPKYNFQIELLENQKFSKRNQHRYYFGIRFLDAPERHYHKFIYEIIGGLSKTCKILKSYYISSIAQLCVMEKNEILKILKTKMKKKDAESAVAELAQGLEKLSNTLHFAEKGEISAQKVEDALQNITDVCSASFDEPRKKAVFNRIAVFLRYYQKSPFILNQSLEDWFSREHFFNLKEETLLGWDALPDEIDRIKHALVNAGLFKNHSSQPAKQHKPERLTASSQ